MREARFLTLGVLCAALSFACGSGTTAVTPLTPSGIRCGVTLVPTISTIESGGGSGVLKVDTARECQWAVSGMPRWMTFKSATEGQGPAEVAFVVDANRSTAERRVELVVAEQRVVISQKAAVCAWKITPDSVSIGGQGGEVRAALATEDFCGWTISSREAWIDVTSDTSGTGNAEVSLNVADNPGAERTGIVEFPSGTLRVTQRQRVPTPPAPTPTPGCTFAVTPLVFDNVASTASERSVDVKAGATCGWTASSNVGWITVSPTTGKAAGSVRLNVAANSGAKRTGTVVVAGQTVTVTQNTGIVPCTYSVAPSSLSLSNSAQTTQVTVTTNKSTCSVKVESNAGWIRVGSFPATGGGKVPLTVDRNDASSKRSATLTVTGENFSQTVKVDQDRR